MRFLAIISFFFALSLFATACSTSQPAHLENPPGTPVQRVFFAEFEEVGRAIHGAMTRYPNRIDNLETGQFESDYLKGDQRFVVPGTKQDMSSGLRYRIIIRMIKGKAENKPATKVLVTKAVEIQRDFFSEPEPLPSDGLEEMVLLYRIQRELNIGKAIKKAQESPPKSNS